MKTKQIFLFFIKMSLIFITFDICTRYMPAIFTNYIFNYKYGKQIVAEGVFALLVLVLVLLFKNTYIFTEKKEPLIKSLFLGLPMIIFGMLSLFVSFTEIFSVQTGTIINLLLFCILIGIAEEFLCRGWIQNEFIERFSSSYKEAFLSVFLSSLIFGAMHITNIDAGQTLFETLMQIVQATSLGFLLGAIYFRTKNIWSVVILHAFYDFSFLLPEANLLKECTTNEMLSFTQTIQGIYSSILIAALFFTSSLIIFRKSKIMPLIEKNKKKQYKDNKDKLLSIIGIIVLLMFIPVGDSENIKTCYNYEKTYIRDYETTYSHKDSFDLLINKDNINYSFTLYNRLNDLVFKNNTTNYEVVLKKIIKKYDKYLLIQNNNNFKIVIFKNDEDSHIYYINVNNESVDNSNIFLDNLIGGQIEYILPDLKDIGSIRLSNEEMMQPFMIDKLNNKFYINDNGKLYDIVD